MSNINKQKATFFSKFVVVKKYLYIIMGALAMVVVACKKESCEQVVPAISLISADRTATNTIVKLQVRDCDGDIGLADNDTAPPNRYNAFVDIRPFLNGDWAPNTVNYVDSTVITEIDGDSNFVAVDTVYDTLNFYYRIPVVDSKSLSDIYDAEIELDVIASDFGYDTFRMEIKIRDQSFNFSNTVLTDQMVVRRQP